MWRPETESFRPGPAETFRRTPDGWARLTDEVAAGVTFDEEGDGLQPHVPARAADY